MALIDRKPLLLVVDDEAANRRVLEAMLVSASYRVVAVEGGREALDAAESEAPDLVLLDVMMPGMDGYEVAARLKSAPSTSMVPIIMVTALDDRDSRLAGLAAGAEDFLAKPVDRAELTVRVRNLLKLKEYGDFLNNHNRILEQVVAERTRALDASYRETITTLTRAASYKDEETGAHVSRISFYTEDIATQMGMDAQFRDRIRHASPMHDVGKIAIPDAILQKSTRFEPYEWEIMKSHAAMGAKLLEGGASDYLRMGAEIAQSHHERWDGGGYPLGIAGESIPLPARIMQVCDVYDALRSRRPYKHPFDHARAVEIIVKGDGRTEPSHFDPQVLAAFVRCAGRFAEIWDTHTDD